MAAKKIPLKLCTETHAIVDDYNFRLLNKFTWYPIPAYEGGVVDFHAGRLTKSGKIILMEYDVIRLSMHQPLEE